MTDNREQLERRIALLAAWMREGIGDPDAMPLAVSALCNGCGKQAAVNLARPSLPGWEIGEHGEDNDFCPDCSGGGAVSRVRS